MRKKRILILASILSIVLISTQSFGIAQGAKFKRTLEAWYNTATIVVNGKEMSSDVKPFIVDGTTYVPLRMMAEIFDKDIHWDPTLERATVSDKPGTSVEELMSRVTSKEIEIVELNKRIDELEAELAEFSSLDIEDLEELLNDDYNEYEDVEFDIKLSGDEEDVIVNIEVDLSDFDDEWNDLDEDDIEDYLQDIVDDILEEYEEADIEGIIEDTYSDDTLVEFDIFRDGDVNIFEFYSNVNLDDLEDELDDYYSDYFSNIDIAVELDGDLDDIDFIIYLEYDDYYSEWNELPESYIKGLMSSVYDDIEDEYSSTDIRGYIYDTDNREYLYKYYLNSSDDIRFIKY